MKCPNCNQTLVMAERQGIEIDYCPDCRGVWLDKGELDKIIERTAGYEGPGSNAAPSGQGYTQEGYLDNHHDGHREGHHGGHRRKGFFKNLFHF